VPLRLVGSEMCIRDSSVGGITNDSYFHIWRFKRKQNYDKSRKVPELALNLQK
jgi:hypothetical protein